MSVELIRTEHIIFRVDAEKSDELLFAELGSFWMLVYYIDMNS